MSGAATPPQLNPLQHHSSSVRRGRCGRVNLAEGSTVEVRTDEEDFKGVYFSATVIQPSPDGAKKKSKKLYVEYHNLLAHEDGSERLREYVDVSFVRPAPPLQEIVKPFEPGDVVDAFYKDGWWTGVVTRVLEGGERYVVTFQNPPDELEFGFAELRVHWDWVNGSWVRAQKQSIAGLMFHVGRKVEVSFHPEDSQDVWFPGTIHEDLGYGAFLVEYCSLDTDNKAQALKVTFNLPHIRPSPPILKDKNFVLLEKVDAFFDFGWWTGVITKELENSRYIVFFKQLRRDKEFSHSELRPHMEWKDGKWFSSSQQQIILREEGSRRILPFLSLLCMCHKLSQDVSIPTSDIGMNEHHTSANSSASVVTIPVNSSGDRKNSCDQLSLPSSTMKKDHSIQLTSDNQKTSHVAASLTKRGQHVSVSQKSLPLEEQQKGNILGTCEQVTHDKSDFVTSIPSSATQADTWNHSSENSSWRKRIRRRQRNIDEIGNVGEKVHCMPYSLKRSGAQILQLECPSVDVRGKEPDAVGNTAVVQNVHAKKETELPIIIGLPCAEMGGSEYGRGRHSNRKEILNPLSDQKRQWSDSTNQKMKDNKQLEVGDLTERRKRGRPRKIVPESVHTPVIGNVQNEVVGSDDLNRKDDDPHRIPEVEMMEMEASLPNQEKMASDKDRQTNGCSDPENGRRSKRKRFLSRMQDEEVVKSISLPGNHSSKRGRRQIKVEKVALLVQDSIDPSGGKMNEVNHAVEVCEAPSNEFDEQPLSRWIEGRHSPSVTDCSRPSPVSTVGQCLDNSKKKGDGVVVEGDSEREPKCGEKVSALVDKDSAVLSEPQSLPFVKNTCLWKTIESLEVFQRIPQRPHFKPLEQFKESSREGLAIGCMVTFNTVVEKTCRLQFGNPKSVTDDILETLADLERHGFDVKVVQNRVSELLGVKDRQEKLVDEVKVLNDQVLEHNNKRSKIEEEIREINGHIEKLQEKLMLVESAKEKEDGEIDLLQARLKETEEVIQNARSDFEGIASSMLSLV